jgi:hypothetical protein
MVESGWRFPELEVASGYTPYRAHGPQMRSINPILCNERAEQYCYFGVAILVEDRHYLAVAERADAQFPQRRSLLV